MASQICPKCGASDRIHQSHFRNAFERLVTGVTPFRRYRCHACSHRLWLREGRWFQIRREGVGPLHLPWWVWVLAFVGSVAVGWYMVNR